MITIAYIYTIRLLKKFFHKGGLTPNISVLRLNKAIYLLKPQISCQFNPVPYLVYKLGSSEVCDITFKIAAGLLIANDLFSSKIVFGSLAP